MRENLLTMWKSQAELCKELNIKTRTFDNYVSLGKIEKQEGRDRTLYRVKDASKTKNMP